MWFESRRKRVRREAAAAPFPDDWRTLLHNRWPAWRSLSGNERQRLEALTQRFVADKRWEAANGFTVTEAMQVLIAAQACLLILELEYEHFRGVKTILLHPRTVVLTGPRQTGTAGLVTNDPYRIDGQAHYRGPVMMSWDAVSYDGRHPHRGLNVVFHEFAHKLDMLDGVIDGTPPLLEGGALDRWVEVCTREYDALVAGTSVGLLRDYGAENPGEFFAVATEMFFSKPVEMRSRMPDLYGVLAAFFRQDPAARYPHTALPDVG